MSDKTGIEWSDATWNPVTGCTKVSPGCDNCYAETFAERWRGTPGHHFENGFDLTLRPERLGQPLRWQRPRRIFVNSMSDLFHDRVSVSFIAEVFAVMAAAHWHTFQLLTKRHGRMHNLLGDADFRELVKAESATLAQEGVDIRTNNPWENWPLPNVWLGVSVEDQKRADLRIPALLDTSAAVRWISAEPLLGPVDLKAAMRTMGSERGHGLAASYVHVGGCCERRLHGIDWVVVGGESGPGARPMHPGWARGLRDQCAAAGVPFLFKQWGQHSPYVPMVADPSRPDGRGPDWNRRAVWVGAETGQTVASEADVPDSGSWQAMYRVGKKVAGRELDGRTWDEYPGGAS